MKNFYTLLLSGLLFCLAGNLSGQTFTVGLTSAEGDVGDEVCVDLVGANFVDIVGLQFTMLFDTTALEFISATGSINGTNVSIVNPPFFPTEIRLSYSPFSSGGYTDEGPFTFGTICFRVRQDITTTVVIDPDPDLFEFSVNDGGGFQFFGPDNASITNGTITGGTGNGSTCTDGIQNGTETGIDCGGSCTPCTTTPTCTDGIQNGTETGIDCGGSCSPCMTAPTCTDGIQNGTETGIDCGGSCSPCMTAPTCTDGVQNGTETGIDCGGSCTPCMTAPSCGEGSSLFHLCGTGVCDIAVGSQACIELNVANFTNITAVQVDLLYPGANLDYVSSTAHPSIGTSLIANERSDGQVRLLFFRSADSPVTLPDGVSFATVCFTNETTAPTTITLDRPRITSTTDNNLQSVLNNASVNDCGTTMPTCTDGIQNGTETGIDCGGSCQPCMTGGGDDDCGEGSDRFNLCVSDACDIAVGGQACVNLSVSMFTNITGFQAKLLYPGSNLDYTNFNSVHPSLGDGLQINEVSDGEVRLFFFRAANMPASVPDGESIITVCFTNQTTATTTIDATQIVVTDTNGDVLGPIANDGMVNGCSTSGETCSDGIMNNGETGVDCGGPNCAACPTSITCGEGTTDVDFCVGSVCGDAGAEVCVPVHIGNFNALGGLQFSLAFTAANLNYTRFIASSNLSGVTVNAPNDSNGNPIDGIVNFIWADLSGVGVSFPADQPVVELCFTVENTNTTPLSFRDPASEVRAVDVEGTRMPFRLNPGAVNQNCGGMETCTDGIMNNGETGVDCGGPNCAACPTSTVCGEGTTDVDFCVGSVCGDAGTEVCVPVHIGNFNALGGLQFSLAFTAANLNYTRFIASSSLPGVTVNAPNDSNGNPIDGIVNFIWADLSGVGVSFPADQPVVELCFAVENTNVTPLSFRDPASEVRAVDVEGTRIAFRLNPGAVNQNCGNMETCTDGIQNNAETGVDCGGPNCASCPTTGTCTDGIQNNGETDIDCGGPNCVPCASTCGEDTNLLSVCIGEACDVAVGSQTCLDLTVGNYDNITGFQFRIFYPGANLDFASITSNPALGDAIQANEFEDGQVRIFYFDSGQEGVTLADGASLGTICFTNEFAGRTTLDGQSLVATNTSGDVIGPIINDGSINGCSAGPSCTNGIKDGDEEGVDCGGSCPTVCATCTDGIMNQDETGIDCGGSCGPCPTGTISLNAGNGMAQIGQQVCINVTVADFADIADVGLTLSYNSASLSLASVTANPALPGFGPSNFTTSNGQIVVSYNPTTPQTLANGEELFEVCFDVTGGDESPLTITNATATTGGGMELTVGTNNGVINSGGVIVYDELSLVANSVSGAEGTEVCVDVRVFNLENLAGLQFAIDYDETKLEYTRAISTNELPGLQVANSNGFLRVIWFDPNVGANSVDDGLSIVAVCFNVLEACTTPIDLTDQPPQFRIRATTPEGELVEVELFDGGVNEGISCGPTGTPPNLILDLGSGSGPVATEVCVDLNVTNFISLTRLNFSISHDAAKVTFSRATNFGFSSLTSVNVGSGTSGSVEVIWNAPVSTGQSLPAGARLVTLCYVVESLEVTPLSFSNSPTTIEARNANNQNVGVIPSGGVINPDAPMVDGLTFQIGSASAEIGEEICLPVIGFQAIDMVGFQYTISYDPAKLQYLGTGPDYAFDGFNNAAVNNSQPGVLAVVWTSPSAIPQTLGDGRALYSVCFRVLSDDLTLVTFGDSPTAIEFENETSILDATLLNGQVNGSAAPSIIAADVRSPRCEGGSDGSIALTVSGGNNLVYRWAPNVSSGPAATGLTPGMYTVMVTNPSTNQSTSETYTVNNGTPFNIEVAEVSGISCNGARDGRILIATVGPDTGPYIFDWSGTLPDGGPEQINLDAGSYSPTVTNANGCVRTLPNIMIGEPGALAIAGSPNDILPGGTGGVTIQVNGGSAPFRYAWTGPGGYTSALEDIADVTVAGTYCLTVIDNNNCSTTQCFAVINALAIVSTNVNVGCAGEENCSIDIEVVGGNGNYDYEWTFDGTVISGDQDLVLTDCEYGDVTVRITSGADVITQVIELEEPTEIVIDAIVRPATSGSNGSIVLTPTGGNPPYSFDWGGGVTDQNRDNLPAGEYCVTVTDDSDCSSDECFIVGASAATILEVLITAPSCFDSEDGIIQIALDNGTAPVNVRIVPLNIDSNFTSTNVSVNVPAGTWRVFLTDAQGSQVDTTVTVVRPEAISAVSTVTSDTEDTGCSGMISLDIAGGTPPYTVAWTGGFTGATISSLCAGEYIPTITDVLGCTFTADAIIVGQIDEELISITDVACADGTEGSIDVSITGGAMPYTFAWQRTGSTDVIADTEDLSGQVAGDYTLTVTDTTGATLMINYTIGISAGFNVNVDVTSDYNGFGATCSDAADGRIVITLSGQGNFMYEFLLDDVMVGIDSVLENAVAGTYTVTVIDAGGCEITRSIEVTAPPAIELSAEVINISCGSTGDGSIAVTPTEGVPTYTFLWSTGATSARITGLSIGDYGLTVTDANGCTAVESYTLTGPEDLAITLEAVEATEGCNGSIRILPLGGSGNYRYNWPQLPNQGNNPFAEGLCPGVYTIEVTDDNECQTVVMTATVLDRSLPCLDVRRVITPDGDGLNEKFVIFCSDGPGAIDNNLQIFNRWGQLVYKANDYDCTDLGGINCFEGETNDGVLLPEGPYYYVFEFTALSGEQMQQRGSLTIIRD